MDKIDLAIIGGSGISQIPGMTDIEWRSVQSPFGPPSDDVCIGKLHGKRLAFLPRHGRGHGVSPSDINYRANIDVLKRLGVRQILSLSAVGSLQPHLEPGDFVIIDQFIDRTRHREHSFFGTGLVGHVSLADPVCNRLADLVEQAAGQVGITHQRCGTYLVMEGPQFSTRAESYLYQQMGCSVIGMTNMPEAKLAREAEICYATVAMVTDYDCWHEDHDAVTVEAVLSVMKGNLEKAKALVAALVPLLDVDVHQQDCDRGCHRALENAIMTAPDRRDPEMVRKLDAVAGRVLGKAAKVA